MLNEEQGIHCHMLLRTEHSFTFGFGNVAVASPSIRVLWVQKPEYNGYMRDWKKNVGNP